MKPILFDTEMVRAILDGRKTTMRKVIKPQLDGLHTVIHYDYDENYCSVMCGGANTINSAMVLHDREERIEMPYAIGDILYVKEMWQHLYMSERVYIYAADADGREKFASNWKGDWKPAIHMPKKAARVFLRVTDMWIERLQDITETDARKEGFEPVICDHPNGLPCTDCLNTGYLEPAMLVFIEEWDMSIPDNEKEIYGYNANPWIWVIKFEIVDKEDAK